MRRRDLLAVLGAFPALLRGEDKNHPVVNDDSIGSGMSMPSGMDMASDNLMKESVQLATNFQAVLTRSGGNLRHNTYLSEKVFTPDSIIKSPPRLRWSAVLPDDACGMESQPLFVPNVTIADGSVRNLMLSSTMANTVWAHDAKTGKGLWMNRLGTPIKGNRTIDGWGINQNWGILSTGAIANGIWYVVAWISPDASIAQAAHYLHAIDITNGRPVQPPIKLTDPKNLQRKQRASLTIAGNMLYIPWGTIAETARGAHGFITAIDISKWQVVDEVSVTPNGSGGGIWMAGQGLTEHNGILYALTGNGDYGNGNYGESFVKVQLANGKLQVLKNWSPFRDADRGKNFADMDLGSGGCIVIPEYNLVCGAGKDGILYVLDINTFQLKAQPIYYTFNGLGLNAQPANTADLNQNASFQNRSHHMHSTSIYWNSQLWCMGENGNLRVGSIGASGKWNFLARSAEQASPYSPVPPGGMPGGFLALSANGNQDGIVWVSIPDGDANRTKTTGRIFAFDTREWGPTLPDGDRSIKRIWMSDEVDPVHPTANGHYSFNKFMPPVPNDGMLYLATYDGHVHAYSS